MNPADNPYRPNAGSPPAELSGREQQLERFRVLAARLERGADEQSVIAIGLRGVGKTVLLNAFEDEAESRGLVTHYRELTPESDLIVELARDIERTLRRLSLSERVRGALANALSHLRTIRISGPEGVGLEVDLAGAKESMIAADLTDLVLEVGRIAREKRTGLVFLLDELQFVDPIQYRALITALHRSNQKRLPVAVAAAGLPQIPQLSGEARSYAERLFDFQRIAYLDETAARRALEEPARREGVTFETTALDLAVEWTRGYPFFLQQLGKHAWNAAAGPSINASDIEAAIPVAQEALDRTIYEVRFQRATPRERSYMATMAQLGEGPYRSGAVAQAMGQTGPALSTLRQDLIDKGLVYATGRGYLDFTVPLFADYVRRVLGE